MLHVPQVDIAPFVAGAPAGERLAVARAFGRALETTGFVTIVGHGVPPELARSTYEAAQAFFAQPLEAKRRYTPPEQAKGRGYLPVGIESVAATLRGPTPPDLCEALVFASIARERVGLGLPNFWPDEPPSLGPCVEAWHDAMQRLSAQLMRLAALALGLPEDWFAPHYRGGNVVLRFVAYPEQPDTPAAGQLRYGAHHDYGGLTILRQDGSPGGLQVCDAGGDWHDVPAAPAALVINVGELLSRWTNDRWRSTLHRVANPPRGAAAATRRLSLVAFTGPDPETEVRCLPSCTGPGRPPRYPPVEAHEFVLAKLRASMELPGR